MAASPPHQRWKLQLSFLEVYKEEVKDLLRLSSSSDPSVLQIREEAGRGVMVSGLSTHEVKEGQSSPETQQP
jgi:hypothetical protein